MALYSEEHRVKEIWQWSLTICKSIMIPITILISKITKLFLPFNLHICRCYLDNDYRHLLRSQMMSVFHTLDPELEFKTNIFIYHKFWGFLMIFPTKTITNQLMKLVVWWVASRSIENSYLQPVSLFADFCCFPHIIATLYTRNCETEVLFTSWTLICSINCYVISNNSNYIQMFNI